MYSETQQAAGQKISSTQVISRNAFGIKECPVCHARCFADMEVCYGCLHSFTEEENQISAVSTTRIPISLEVKGDLEESDLKVDGVKDGVFESGELNADDLKTYELKPDELKTDNLKTEMPLNDVAIRSDLPINEMPPESFKTQVALTDLLEIVISVRAPVKDPEI